MKDYILNLVKHIDETVYPNTYIPLYQVLSAFVIGLFFGAFHSAFIWTITSYIAFEFILRLSTRNRPHLYVWPARIMAICASILGILFSKCIWGNGPIFRLIL